MDRASEQGPLDRVRVWSGIQYIVQPPDALIVCPLTQRLSLLASQLTTSQYLVAYQTVVGLECLFSETP